jgi:hypothetical protein
MDFHGHSAMLMADRVTLKAFITYEALSCDRTIMAYQLLSFPLNPQEEYFLAQGIEQRETRPAKGLHHVSTLTHTSSSRQYPR